MPPVWDAVVCKPQGLPEVAAIAAVGSGSCLSIFPCSHRATRDVNEAIWSRRFLVNGAASHCQDGANYPHPQVYCAHRRVRAHAARRDLVARLHRRALASRRAQARAQGPRLGGLEPRRARLPEPRGSTLVARRSRRGVARRRVHAARRRPRTAAAWHHGAGRPAARRLPHGGSVAAPRHADRARHPAGGARHPAAVRVRRTVRRRRAVPGEGRAGMPFLRGRRGGAARRPPPRARRRPRSRGGAVRPRGSVVLMGAPPCSSYARGQPGIATARALRGGEKTCPGAFSSVSPLKRSNPATVFHDGYRVCSDSEPRLSTCSPRSRPS